MTESRQSTQAKQLTHTEVVQAGLDTLDAVGLDSWTMRRVADRLGVQLNTVYWHAKNKSALLDLMADELLAGCADGRLPRPWRKRVITLAARYRAALLSRRDGGRLSIARFHALPNTIRLSEALHKAFVDGGLPPAVVSHAAWSVSYLTLASVIEEQGEPADWAGEWERSSPTLRQNNDLAEALRYSVSADYRVRFEFSIDLLLAGLDTTRGES
ncbi:TetR/AcrR family transcriptional regulator C-terminal domain-containing protein [Nocardia sp. NPDC005998]|uniref:TetR/AcrR family transcriptional regulator C-terminal domain-containing protein n=1 Tax=Nocardia sp. NPDC005998 TaxID=3156894 RepID=UPI0033BCC9F1